MNSNTIQITLAVDDQGTVKIRQFGKEAAAAGSAGSKGFDGLRQSSGLAEASVGKTNAAVSLMKATIASLVSVMTVEKLIALADAYTRIEGRLKLVTSSSGELAAVQASLYDIAQRSRAEYIATADVFNRFAQATKGQNIAQSELLTLTETLSKAFVISGANTQEQSAAMVQLSQGFASGVLRGDEFNSVMEAGGRVIDLLTAYTGKSRGELRAMAEAGEITGDVMRNAIMAGAAGVNDEFGRMPMTVGQAGTKLTNVLGMLVSDLDKATSSSGALAASISSLADTIDNKRGSILSFFGSLATIANPAFSGAEMMAEAATQGVERLERVTTSKVPAIQASIKDLEAELARINAAPGLKAIKVEKGEYATIEYQLARQRDLLKQIQSSPYITGEAAGKINLVAAAYKGVTFQMQGVKPLSESSMKVTEAAHKKTLEYIETERQALAKKRDEMLKGAKTDAERSAVELKYRAEVAKLDERESRRAEAASRKSESAAKKLAQEYQAVLDKLLPLEAEQREYNKQLAILDQAIPDHSSERYKTALENLEATLTANVEKTKELKAARDALADWDVTVAQINMSAAEKEIDNLQRANTLIEKRIELLVASGDITRDLAEQYHQAFGKKLQSDIEAVIDKANELGRMFEDVAKDVKGSVTDMIMDLMDGTRKGLDGILTMFKRLIAEMATMALAKPIIIPMITTVGTAMGMSNASIAKAAGVDTSQISGGLGIGSLFGGSLGGMASGGLESIGYASLNQGFDTLGNSALSLSRTLDGMSAGMSGALVAGVGSIAMSLLSGQGLTAQTGLQAGGAALGAALTGGSPLGAMLGGLAGNLLGGLFGSNGPDTFRATPIATNLGVNYDRNTGMTPTGYQFSGGDTDSRIYAAMAPSIAKLQEAFNTQVDSLIKAIPESMGNQILDSLAAVDFKSQLYAVASGEWKVGEAEEALKTIATTYATSMVKSLGTAYADALSGYITANGAAGLVGNDTVWGLLTEKVKGNIEQAYTSAAATIKGGDIDGGLSAISNINTAIAQIGQAMAPISEIIATNGLSEYELSLRAINIQFDQHKEALKVAGVDMAKYTDLETARGMAIKKVTDAEDLRIAEEAAALAGSRRGLEIQIMELTGNTAGALAATRANELAAMDQSLRPLQQRIYDLQDEAIATAAATALAAQRSALEIQIMELTGDTAGALAATRANELAAMDESLRPLQQRIYDLQDEASATAAAAEAVKELAARMQAVADAKAPIEEILATNGMSEYELRLRAVNKQFDEYGKALEAAGVKLADYPQYYQAWALALKGVVDPALQAAADTTQKIADKLRQGLQTALDNANTALDAARTALQASFGAEQSRLDQAHKSALAAMNDQLKASQAHLSAMSSLSGSLQSSLASMSVGTAAEAMATRAAAQAALASALTSAQRGNMAPAQALSGSLSVLTKSDTGLFATAEDYQRDYYKTYNQISELSKIAGAQVGQAEGTVTAIERQIEAENAWYEAETKMLSDQLDAILGVDSSVLSLTDAIRRYNGAQAEVAKAKWELSELNRRQENKELVDEIKQLRAELRAQNEQIARNTQRTAAIMDKWDYDGMPAETVA